MALKVPATRTQLQQIRGLLLLQRAVLTARLGCGRGPLWPCCPAAPPSPGELGPSVAALHRARGRSVKQPAPEESAGPGPDPDRVFALSGLGPNTDVPQ